jgi:UDP-2-acetamido-2,6-beta-L-arabino-hexul-4-ose reductase
MTLDLIKICGINGKLIMIKVGITGQNGFIGSHLYNYLGLQEGIELVHFEKSYFDNSSSLDNFITKCDTIVHLAAMNRHEDPQVIYDTNVQLVNLLIDGCTRTGSTPHIIFSSSSQEEAENLYGQSKLKGRSNLEQWAAVSGAKSTGMVIPNVFGPFGKPFYNSVVATFCYQLTHGQVPTINIDGELKLIYINELVSEIFHLIKTGITGKIVVAHSKEIKVSAILSLLTKYKTEYLEKGIFPDLNNAFEKALFNTFRCFVPKEHYPFLLKNNIDDRGNFVEIARTNSSGQFSFSTTHPGITRGNHFHTRKAERFAVIKGKARIALRKMDEETVIEYFLDGDQPAFVDMPIWHTHNITNIGEGELLTLFWINEPYNADDPDTYFVNV